VLGRATKLSESLMSTDKEYTGSIKLGETTDSHDADGTLVASLPVPPLTLEELNQQAGSFVGDQLQTPPMVSAVKKHGVPLYALARKGLEVPREPRLIHIYRWRFSDYHEPFGQFEIACTKGTYVRSLAHELGQKIGCGAHLAALRRTASGSLRVDRAIPLDNALAWTKEQLAQNIIPFRQLLTMIHP
jgi:tRNA pseudouridine55 synthase